MRTVRILSVALVVAVALVAALARFGGACGLDTDNTTVALPGPVAGGVVHEDHFYAVSNGKLIDVDLKQGTARNVGGPDAKLLPYLDVAGGEACVASADHLFTVDLAAGKVHRSMEFRGDIAGLGFAGADRVFVLRGPDVVLVDLARGETVKTVAVCKEKGNRAGKISCCDRVGDRLYTIDGFRGNLSIVDLKQGELVEQVPINAYSWFSGLRVVGDRAILTGVNLSYGINNPHWECLDLKTKKWTQLHAADFKDRVEDKDFTTSPKLGMASCPNGTVCITGTDGLYQYDNQGKEIGKTALPAKDHGRLVGVWKGQALLAGPKSLERVKLAKPTAKTE